MRTPRLAVCLVLAIPAPAAAEVVPACSEAADAFRGWRDARNKPTGVTASDRDRFLVPTATAGDECAAAIDFSMRQPGRFDDGIHAWLYASRCKETACGKPETIERNCTGWLFTGECDLNNNIRLAEGDTTATRLDRYQCLTENPELASEGSGLCLQKPGKGWIVHAEITAPRGRARTALHEAWWPERNGDTNLDDKDVRAREWRQQWYSRWAAESANGTLCVYGPIAADTGHGLKAEVHPAQMIWWNRAEKALAERTSSPYAANGPYDLLFIQDASARYGLEHGYVIVDDFPEVRAWRPWSQAPLTAEFQIPIWVDEKALDLTPCPPEKQGDEQMGRARRAEPKAAFEITPWRPWAEGTAMTEEVDKSKGETPEPACVSSTAPRLYVQNLARSTTPNRFGVRVDWACACDASTCGAGYLGYLRIDATVGLDRDFGEGALGLTVTDVRARRAVPARPMLLPSEPATTDIVKGPVVTLTGHVRRILEDRRGQALERPARLGYDAGQAVPVLLQRAGWVVEPLPLAADRPPVFRPDTLTLEVQHEWTGVSDREEQTVKVHTTWHSVKACELRGGDPDPCHELLSKPQEGREITVRLPDTVHPLEVHLRATVRAEGEGVRSESYEIGQKLWAERLVLDATRIDEWIGRHSADHEGQSSRECPKRKAALVNLLAEAKRRGEVSVTTLALVAAALQGGCQ